MSNVFNHMTKSGHDGALVATNHDAFESKISAMRAGYFSDSALSAMAERYAGNRKDVGRFGRPPLINRGTYARVLLKETLVEAFLRNSYETGKPVQIVSLGAGFDTHPFVLAENAASLPPFHFVELDFPAVVKQKVALGKDSFSGKDSVFTASSVDIDGGSARAIIRRDKTLSVEECSTILNSRHPRAIREDASYYSMRSVDLRDLSSLSKVLDELKLESEYPLLVLAEIVLVYMQPQHSDGLISLFSRRFNGSRVFVAIEHTLQKGEFGNQMVRNIASRGSPLLGLHSYATISSQERRFKQLGWAMVRVETLLQAFQKRIQNPIPLNKIEILDELEEWRLIMGHYCIVCAVGGRRAEKLLDDMKIEHYKDFPFRQYSSDVD